jgi:L-ascorbate metabolism protein UlaG (beta-lactamase superfamily)
LNVTYIYHSGFFVELDNISMLFDYYTGTIPPVRPDKPLLVFSSHSHGDHYSRKIYDLADKADVVRFILSDDIEERTVPKKLKDKTLFVGPDQAYDLGEIFPALSEALAKTEEVSEMQQAANKASDIQQAADEASDTQKKTDGASGTELISTCVKIHTLKSNDLGVAFLIETDGKKLYHAGDLNNWWWDGGPVDIDLEKIYHEELARIKGEHFDAAFIPLDPRIEGYWMGVTDFLSSASADIIFPMHFGSEHRIIKKMKEKYPALKDQIADITQKGQVFDLP